MSRKLQVLRVYRRLMRTRLIIFAGDEEAIMKSRLKIRESFLANANTQDPLEIAEHVKCAEETNEFLLQGVVQGQLDSNQNTYKVKITEHTKLHDNVPLKESNKVDFSNFTVPERFKKDKT